MLVFLTTMSFLLNYAYPRIPVILWYLINVNVFSFLLFSIDKYHAIKDKKRVPETGLYYFSFIGGVFGALCAMIIWKHKTTKKFFLYAQLGLLLLWLIIIGYILLNFEKITRIFQGLFA